MRMKKSAGGGYFSGLNKELQETIAQILIARVEKELAEHGDPTDGYIVILPKHEALYDDPTQYTFYKDGERMTDAELCNSDFVKGFFYGFRFMPTIVQKKRENRLANAFRKERDD